MSSKPSYKSSLDRTLRSDQRALGGFKKIFGTPAERKAALADFRYRSKPTSEGYSSGYHEAGLTTDTAKGLRKRKRDGEHSEFLADVRGPLKSARFLEAPVKAVIAAGDGARTDTAQTILTTPATALVRAAGHSGSGVSQTGQGLAHDVVRRSTLALLRDGDTTPAITAAVMSAVTVTTMAPGEVASTAERAHKLKAAQVASTWEQLRQRGKSRTKALVDQLPVSAKAKVHAHMDRVFVELGHGRRRAPGRSTSPVRELTAPTPGKYLSGGAYRPAGTPLPSPSRPPPASFGPMAGEHGAREATLYASKPFRAKRPE